MHNLLVSHFDRDPKTNKLLWFSGPPINPPAPSSYVPRHSLSYLTYIARKKLEAGNGQAPSDPTTDHMDGALIGAEQSPDVMQLLDRFKQRADGSFYMVDDNVEEQEQEEASHMLVQSLDGLAYSLVR